jgi:hypothetical protein
MGDIFVSTEIINWSSKTVVVKNVHLHWGKFYKDSKSPKASACVVVPVVYLDLNACILDDRDSEIPISDIENTEILPGKKYKINSRGLRLRLGHGRRVRHL